MILLRILKFIRYNTIPKFLYNITGKMPCKIIHLDDVPYLERYYVGRLFNWTFYLHRFVSSDDERVVHDHPWNISISFILAGRYLEERFKWFNNGIEFTYHNLSAFGINVIRGGDFHRIKEPDPETWSLFCHSKRVKQWGFLKLLDDNNVMYYPKANQIASAGWFQTAKIGNETITRDVYKYRYERS